MECLQRWHVQWKRPPHTHTRDSVSDERRRTGLAGIIIPVVDPPTQRFTEWRARRIVEVSGDAAATAKPRRLG